MMIGGASDDWQGVLPDDGPGQARGGLRRTGRTGRSRSNRRWRGHRPPRWEQLPGIDITAGSCCSERRRLIAVPAGPRILKRFDRAPVR